MARPRAADDFLAIRARMEELRRERASLMQRDQDRRADQESHVVDYGRGRGKTRQVT